MELGLVNPYVAALFVAIFNERVVEVVGNWLFNLLGWNKEWLLGLALLTGFVFTLWVGTNVFAPVLGNGLPGVVLTAIAVGLGSSFLHEMLPNKK